MITNEQANQCAEFLPEPEKTVGSQTPETPRKGVPEKRKSEGG
jgi:hypothetical protein